MTKTLQKFGGVSGKRFFGTNILSKLILRELNIFPVPGENLFIIKGFNIYQKGIKMVASPRHANLLLIAGPLSPQLRKAAAISYSQMPRPRILVTVDLQEVEPLPRPDLVISPGELNQLPSKLKNRNLWARDSEAYRPSFLVEEFEDDEEKDEHGEHNMNEHEDHGDHSSRDGNDDNEENGGHDQGGGDDFMSMIMMTKDMPRAADGLPMDMNEGRFGPFHLGLPDGLRIKMMLDGDTVKMANFEKGLLSRHFLDNFPKDDPSELPGFLGNLDPLQPMAYKQLATKALRNTSNCPVNANISALEKERIIYHLLQIQTLLQNVGDQEMHFRIHKSLRDFLQDDSAEGIKKNTEKLKKRFYLKNRLRSCGKIPEMFLHHVSGPVARAAGKKLDHRMEDPDYAPFEAITLSENNAWGYLLVRLEEISQSLDLIKKFSEKGSSELITEKRTGYREDYTGSAKIETATGTACLDLNIRNGRIQKIKLKTPSVALAAMIPKISMQQELSDALAGIASLGISAWEIDK
ncbi:hypothetical protein [Zunongwangia sp. H14]|uniref:NADH-quinone oxidoreductase subunit D-related protein n=1 Tax=Zunongwangia sp. H14 TaxID=3240792 RepID=UPI003569FA7A